MSDEEITEDVILFKGPHGDITVANNEEDLAFAEAQDWTRKGKGGRPKKTEEPAED